MTEAASDVLRAVYDPKLNEGTLAGQAAEFMSIMSHKVRRCCVHSMPVALGPN